MSGHSHYSTIKRQKEAKDAARGKVFSRHSKAIAIAIKEGGSASPEMNSKLRFAIDQAKADNMPKVNIERVLARAEEVGNIEEVTYEGYAPEGVAVIIKAATDNKNRTAQEIKNLFERAGGSLAGPGSVAYNFTPKGLVVVKKVSDAESQTLALIDLGIEDVEETDDALEVYTAPSKVGETRQSILDAGYEVDSFGLVMKPLNLVSITAPEKAKKIISFLDSLEDYEDIQDVFANFDIPPEVVKQITAAN